jgi:hypothetical protein
MRLVFVSSSEAPVTKIKTLIYFTSSIDNEMAEPPGQAA